MKGNGTMPNTREKLIEMVKQGYNKYFNPNWDLDLFALIADHLIANGVTFDKDIYALTKKIAELEKSNRNWRRKMQKIRQRYAKKDTAKWIPVTERFPDGMDWVLCTCKDGEVRILAYDYIMDDWDIYGRPNSCYGKAFVTHWMPLPEPPKGE